ncbi:MAG: aminoacyl-tRNA hydrolase [Bacteroidota bacterium]
MKYLITGLGNIGNEYELTRHNIGFMILDSMAVDQGEEFKTEKLASKLELKHRGRTLILIKPSTYMNLSGKAVKYWMEKEHIPKERILVITDDLALPFGKLRMRAKGSNAGHNGLGSIDSLTGGNNYARLKCGIGDNFSKGQQVDYVLSKFSNEEFKTIDPFIEKAKKMILSFAAIGIERTMNEFND